MADPSDVIAEIEARIQSLTEAAEQCRKIIVIAKAALGAGGLLLLGALLGLVRFDPAILVLAITALLAGIALSGSNRSTLDEIRGKIRALEAQRRALIDAMALRVVEGA